MLETPAIYQPVHALQNHEGPIMPSLNHSYICLQIIKQLINNQDIEPLPELTLDIANGLTPDISVFHKTQIQPNPFHDIPRFQERPILAIEVVSSSQAIQEMLQKATQLVNAGIPVVWTVEPYSRTVFVTTSESDTLFHEALIENEGVQVVLYPSVPEKNQLARSQRPTVILQRGSHDHPSKTRQTLADADLLRPLFRQGVQ